jgi:hypothetical protein
MKALLRYAFVKSSREHLLFGLLLAPMVMTTVPMLGIGLLLAVRGQGLFPLHFPEYSPESTAGFLGICAVVLSAIVAAVGAFSIFRSEVANRTVGLFFLAKYPRAVSLASTVYGLLAGVASYVLASAGIRVLTDSPPPGDRSELLIAVIAAMAGSALGSALVAISPEMIVLVPAYAGAILVAIVLLDSTDMRSFIIIPAIAVVLTAFAPILLRRRCAV